MEVRQVGRVTATSASSPEWEGRYSILVRIQGCIYQTLLDSGSSQALIHQILVRPGTLLETLWVEIKCVHGDVHIWSWPLTFSREKP